MGPKTVAGNEDILYDISMKKLFIFVLLAVTLPTYALEEAALERAVLKAPVDETIFQVYSADKALNSRRAIRLGYTSFHARINTPQATTGDTNIAIFITTKLQPFFNKLNQLENVPEPLRSELVAQYNDEFVALAVELARLFHKNQQRYTNPAFLDDSAALAETVIIIQEAVDKGTF